MFKSLKGFLANSVISPDSNADSSTNNANPESSSTDNSPITNTESPTSPNASTNASAEGSTEAPKSMTTSMYNDAAAISDELKKSLNVAKGFYF